jgi:hypothetical protein
MSLSNKKILTSGCGVSWSGQEKKTWVNVLKTVGADIVDVGGPAVSNQWILNRTIDHLIRHSDVDQVIVQLTCLDKLDVEVNDQRIAELVEPDSIRNFTIDGVWPSSASLEHPAKQLWSQWLSSPGLEIQDITVKLVLLNHWCTTHNIALTVFQAYSLPWTQDQKQILQSIVDTDSEPAAETYAKSHFYQWHDHAGLHNVPCLEYQFELALMMSRVIDTALTNRVQQVRDQYFAKHHAA